MILATITTNACLAYRYFSYREGRITFLDFKIQLALPELNVYANSPKSVRNRSWIDDMKSHHYFLQIPHYMMFNGERFVLKRHAENELPRKESSWPCGTCHHAYTCYYCSCTPAEHLCSECYRKHHIGVPTVQDLSLIQDE